MEITVSEALRFKNEIAAMVKKLESDIRYPNQSQITFGIRKENDVIISDSNGVSFETTMANLIKILAFSEEINNALSHFNRNSAVDNLVRRQSNLRLIHNVYEVILPHTKPVKTKKFETVGNKREEISIEFIPSIKGSDVKKKQSELKNEMRKIQTEIEKHNQGNITLSFSYEDVEALSFN